MSKLRSEKLSDELKLVLGLEIHLHLKTETKMFCECTANFYDDEPNTHTCPVCLGLPGALPIPNYEAIKKAHMVGIALNCFINKESKFDRKHYFYPDLPKGYQISQYKQPLCEDGHLVLSSREKISIERVHIEEDTAKSFHKGNKTLIDFNKSGVPLVEIVTEPEFESIEDAVEFSKQVQDIVRWLKLGDVDMEKGQMRLEANISLRTLEMERKNILPDYKVEIKNINSFRFMERAVKAEVIRQKELLISGKEVKQENRGYDEKNNMTVSQRRKEEAHDYRYFPEPDIPPLEFSEEYIEEIKNSLGELPIDIADRLKTQYGLSEKSALFFSRYPGLFLIEKFEELASENLDPTLIANLLINKPRYRDYNVEKFKKEIIKSEDLIEDEDQLLEAVKKAIRDNSKAVKDYKRGKESSLEFLLGQVIRETKGKASPSIVRKIIKKELSS